MISKKRVLMASLILCLIASACGDMNQDDYRRKRVEDEEAKIAAVAGTYNGKITQKSNTAMNLLSNPSLDFVSFPAFNALSNPTLGTLSMELKGDVDFQNSYDNLTSEPKAIMRGHITYDGDIEAQVPFSQGYFSAEQNNFVKVTLSIQDASRTTRELSIQGHINNGVLDGTIGDENASDFEGAIHLVKDGPVALHQNLVAGGRAAELASETGVFIGNYTDSVLGDCQFKLTLLHNETSNEQDFLNIFRPERSVTAIVDLGHDAKTTFKNATLDDRHNVLRTTDANSTDASSQYAPELTCKRQMAGSVTVSWDCTFVANGIITHSVLKPASANTAENGKSKQP